MITRKLHNEFSEMIDFNLNDPRRICKVPYSLAVYPDDIFVCIPLTIKELQRFKLSHAKPSSVLAKLVHTGKS